MKLKRESEAWLLILQSCRGCRLVQRMPKVKREKIALVQDNEPQRDGKEESVDCKFETSAAARGAGHRKREGPT